MMDLQTFKGGMKALCTMYREPLTADLIDAYFGVLGQALTAEEWRATVLDTLRSGRTFMPRAGELLAPFREAKARQTSAAAAEVFQALADGECMEYRPTGSVQTVNAVRAKFGEVAARAFVAAGGTRRFGWIADADRPFLQRAFVEAYSAEHADEELRALAAGPAPAGLLAEGGR